MIEVGKTAGFCGGVSLCIKRLNEEIDRYSLTSSASPEVTTIRTYIDWLLCLPWNKLSKDNTDIKKIEEVYDMGYEDYIYSGNLCLIEWPELIEELLPEDTLRVTIEQNADNTRTITL